MVSGQIWFVYYCREVEVSYISIWCLIGTMILTEIGLTWIDMDVWYPYIHVLTDVMNSMVI